MILHYSRNPNPRLALTVARYLDAPITLHFAEPFHPDQAAKYRALNPSQLIPILEEPGQPPLWEADAIACRLAMGGDLWPLDRRLPEVIRWISWGKATFVQACELIHWELGTKQRYGIGPVDWEGVERGLADFHRSAAQLDAHLKTRDFLIGALSYADFRMACFLPYDDVTELPLADYPALHSWAQRMADLPFWADPFQGLDVPPLPPAPPRSSYRRQSPEE
ncbi:glutathione S-transferase family protein [Stagnihabitans tardus]|uniref:Glutathione S-transferase family protein n=1 Tax=Stagnihabitans tardus TaxID=2699202 RepID=A0AAE5BU80_9RHOB|nr:glutathione S-transferase family protein [Stagnihabitans tardus]NBZ89870.1 glutathione S-transferase family protein [Stagnihabitans tardus]